MRSLWLLLLILWPLPALAAATPAPAPVPLRVLVPAYFYPSGPGLAEWRRLARAARDVPIVAIANPASGPGNRQDANYTEVIDLARKAGVTVIGYVSTRYAKRPQNEVKTDIDRWLQFYPGIDGFFFDEQASGKEQASLYQAIAEYASKRRPEQGAFIVTNPGTATAAEYLTPWKGIHVSCVQEDKTSLERYQPPAWITGIPPVQVAGLVYGETSIAGMRRNVQLAASKGVGFLYVTDDSGNNPWDRLPTYWELEVAELQRAYTDGMKPGLCTLVPTEHWAYDALQQLARRGFSTGYPDGTFSGKRGFTRLQVGGIIQRMLRQMESSKPPTPLPTPAEARADIRALEKLSIEFRTEMGLFGVTTQHAALVIEGLAAKLGVPGR